MAGRLAAFAIIVGIFLLAVPSLGWGTSNWYDLGGVLCIVLGALVTAVRGEPAEEELVQHNRRRTDKAR